MLKFFVIQLVILLTFNAHAGLLEELGQIYQAQKLSAPKDLVSVNLAHQDAQFSRKPAHLFFDKANQIYVKIFSSRAKEEANLANFKREKLAFEKLECPFNKDQALYTLSKARKDIIFIPEFVKEGQEKKSLIILKNMGDSLELRLNDLKLTQQERVQDHFRAGQAIAQFHHKKNLTLSGAELEELKSTYSTNFYNIFKGSLPELELFNIYELEMEEFKVVVDIIDIFLSTLSHLIENGKVVRFHGNLNPGNLIKVKSRNQIALIDVQPKFGFAVDECKQMTRSYKILKKSSPLRKSSLTSTSIDSLFNRAKYQFKQGYLSQRKNDFSREERLFAKIYWDRYKLGNMVKTADFKGLQKKLENYQQFN